MIGLDHELCSLEAYRWAEECVRHHLDGAHVMRGILIGALVLWLIYAGLKRLSTT
jgi:hypothetical protein